MIIHAEARFGWFRRPACFAILFLMFAASTFCHAVEPGAGFHVVSYRLQIATDFASKSVRGVETIKLRSLMDGLQTVTFSGNALAIDSAAVNGRALEAAKTSETTSFELPEGLQQGSTVTLRIAYHGIPSRGLVFSPTSVYTTYYACDWMFCSEDASGDKATFQLDLTVPEGMSSLAVGKLIRKSKLEDGGEIDRWELKQPYSAYLYDFAIGKYVKATSDQNGAELTYLSDIATEAELQKIFKETGPMVRFLTEKAGVGLPAKSYAQLLVPGKAAQETASYSIIGKDYLSLAMTG